MNKIQAVMKLYKTVFPNAKLEQRGSWIRIDDSCAYYSNDLLEEIFMETGNMYEWDSENKTLNMIAAHSDSCWDTNDSWNTQGPIHVTKPASGRQILAAYEEEGLFDDIGEI